jgi:hypothetical protein
MIEYKIYDELSIVILMMKWQSKEDELYQRNSKMQISPHKMSPN